MKKYLLLISICALFYGGITNAQQNPQKDKKKIELKPNSREYRPVRMNNYKQRTIIKRDKAIILKKRAEMRQMKMQIQKKRAFKQEQTLKRRQIIQQRRATRR